MTLFVLGFAECSSTRSKEAVAEEVILVLRNGAQLIRLGRMVDKYVVWRVWMHGRDTRGSFGTSRNRRQLGSRSSNIDFESIGEGVLDSDDGTLPIYNAPSSWDEDEDFF